MSERGWQREFEDPIPLPDGDTRHAPRRGNLCDGLPKKEAALPECQAAIETLMLV